MASSLPSVSTEHGFSLALSGGLSGTFKLSNVGALTETRKEVATSHHGTTGFETFIVSDLAKVGNVEFDVLYEGKLGLPNLDGVQGTATVTFPKAADQSVAGGYAGTAYIISRSFPGGAAGSANVAKGKFALLFDGYTFAVTLAS